MNPNFFNLTKRKKRDRLSELLLGKSTEGLVGKKELNAVNRLLEVPSANKSPVNINDQPQQTKNVSPAQKRPQKPKKKKTHYLAQEISESIDRTQTIIRSLVSENLRYRISKSLIVNQSLAMILQEFEVQGKNSRLVRSIMQKTCK